MFGCFNFSPGILNGNRVSMCKKYVNGPFGALGGLSDWVRDEFGEWELNICWFCYYFCRQSIYWIHSCCRIESTDVVFLFRVSLFQEQKVINQPYERKSCCSCTGDLLLDRFIIEKEEPKRIGYIPFLYHYLGVDIVCGIIKWTCCKIVYASRAAAW